MIILEWTAPSPIPSHTRSDLASKLILLSPNIRQVEVLPDGSAVRLHLSEPDEQISAWLDSVLSGEMQLSRFLRPKLLASHESGKPTHDPADCPSCGYMVYSDGRVTLRGPAERLMARLQRRISAFAAEWAAEAVRFSPLIAQDTLVRCGYFDHFPQNMGMVLQVRHDYQSLQSARNIPSDGDLSCLEPAGLALTPSICYHVFQDLAGQALLDSGCTILTAAGTCFRHEHKDRLSATRLKAFNMHEVVFLGGQHEVADFRGQLVRRVWDWWTGLGLPGTLQTASDPFFVDLHDRAAYQSMRDLKIELRVPLAATDCAVASFNLHGDYFGQHFAITHGQGAAFSGCIGFGLERVVYAMLSYFGCSEENWPL